MATYWVATTGNDTTGTGSQANPFRQVNRALQALSASGGDTIIVRPGTFSSFSLNNGPNAPAGNKHLIKAEFARINCTGDACARRTSNVTTISTTITLGSRNNYIIEGFLATIASQTPGDLAAGVEIRYCEFTGHVQTCIAIYGTANEWHVHHCLFYDPSVTDGQLTDYGIALHKTNSFLIEKNVFAGGMHHHVSTKRVAHNVVVRDNIFLGARVDSIQVGQNFDDTVSLGDTEGTLLPGSESVRNHTSNDNLIERNIITDWVDTAFPTRYHRNLNPIRVQNALRAVIRYNYLQNSINWFVHVERHSLQSNGTTSSGTPLHIGERTPTLNDVDIYGNTVVNIRSTSQGNGILITGSPYPTDNIRIFNNTFFQSGDPAIRARGRVNTSFDDHAWYSTSTLSATDLQFFNNIFHSMGGVFQTQTTGLTISAEGDNCWFNSGGSRGATGDITSDPLLVGPTSGISASQTAANSLTPSGLPPVWNFDGGITWLLGEGNEDRWTLQGGSPCLGAGRSIPSTDIQGNPIDFTGGSTPDIGSNQVWGFTPGEPGVTWNSAAIYDVDDPVFDGAEAPWITTRDIVCDVDVGLKQFVFGIGTDPLDADTFDTDIYVQKSAFLQVGRDLIPITLSSGVSGEPADQTDAAWRTRATYTYTQADERVIGVWFKFETGGGSHSWTGTADWAFQGVA